MEEGTKYEQQQQQKLINQILPKLKNFCTYKDIHNKMK